MTSLVVRKVKSSGAPTLKVVSVVLRVISEGLVKLERAQVICPACRQQVEAVATDGRVKGYCAVAKQDVDFMIETQRIPIGEHFTAETRAKISASVKKRWQDPGYRARMSAVRKERWQDPEYQARQSAARTGKRLTAETKARISGRLRGGTIKGGAI